jgi:23S rRNA (adenine1618-N6)-methyltransferase
MTETNRHSKPKSQLHPRNRHRDRYDLPALIADCRELEPFVSPNAFQDLSIDFTDPRAVKTLNKALLKHFYKITFWDIPEGYLCPPVPGRADYLHYAADLLASGNDNKIPRGRKVRVLDIGTGANGIYPLIGVREYGWKFVGSEIDPVAIRSVQGIVRANDLATSITIRKQTSGQNIFQGVIHAGEKFDLTICNPPFYSSSAEAEANASRKWKNLEKKTAAGTRNFGGSGSELWCAGGEKQFLQRMIIESSEFADRCLWFTSLVSSKDSLPWCYKALDRIEARDVKTIQMSQGNKISRMLAWTFQQPAEMSQWRSRE